MLVRDKVSVRGSRLQLDSVWKGRAKALQSVWDPRSEARRQRKGGEALVSGFVFKALQESENKRSVWFLCVCVRERVCMCVCVCVC